MAGKSSTDKETISSREMELMAHALKCIKGDITIDYDKFAELAGFKNKGVASVTWGRLRRKLDRMSTDTTDTTSKSSSAFNSEQSPVPTKKAAGKKRKAVLDEVPGSTSAKMPKKRYNEATDLESNSKAVSIKSEPDSEEEGSGTVMHTKEDSDGDEF